MNRVIKDESCIPKEALLVKVPSIINPYYMRMYEVDNHAFKANAIRKKLEIYAKKNLNFQKEVKEMLNLNDSLIVMSSPDNDIPAWYCRGILGHMTDDQMKFNVFLPDYGISSILTPSDFRKVPEDAIPDKYLSETIALNNILPASVAKNNKSKVKTIVTIVEEWTESAIGFTKELVGASNRIYFHPTGHDENEKLFGELYLDIEDEIIILSKALTYSFFAVKLNKSLLNVMYSPDSFKNGEVKRINGSILIDQCYLDDEPHELALKVKEKNSDDSSASNETGTEGEKFSSQDCNIVAIDGRQKNMFKKHDQEIFVRSKFACKCLENIVDARFPEKIHKVLENQHINRPMKIESYMWPAIAKGLDVIAISSSRAGKTFGYLLPIASYLATNKLATGTKPTTLVLCSSSSNVDTIANLFQEFLQDYPHIKVVSALNGKPENTLMAHILNGCQVLVSTVPFLTRFLRKYGKNDVLNLDLSRLRHIILDGGDVMLDKYMESMMEIFIKHEVIREKHDLRDNDLSLQMIAVGEQWTKGLSYFMDKFTVYPFVCIGSYLEAAAFNRVQVKLFILRMEDKHAKILETINKLLDSNTEKTMIICTSVIEAKNLNEFLRVNEKKTLLAHSEMLFNAVHDIKHEWDNSVSGVYPILICTDDILSDLNIKDAKCLIHHSINSTKKTRFYYRFSTLRAHWQRTDVRCKVFIMVDFSNNKQFNGLLDIMKRLHASLPAEWIKSAKIIALNLDKEKRAYPICDNIKAMGFCPKNPNCSYRHCILSPEDDPKIDVQIGDKVELMVTYIHNASHFSARLVKCYKTDQKEPITYPSDVKLSIEIQNFFSNVENRKGLKIINVGDICAMEDTIDNYLRVKVLSVVARNEFDEPSEVIVKFIDYHSDFITVKTSKLLDIPKRLGQWQTHNFDVYLNNLEAYDKEYEWDKCADKAAANWFEDFYTSKCHVIARVNLHLENTFWVSTLEMRTKISGFPEFTVSSLRNYLIEKNHAIENKEHLPQLYQLCKSGGLELKDLKIDEDFNEHEQVD